MYHHLIVGWDGRTQAEEFQPGGNIGLAQDWETHVKATPDKFTILHNESDPILIQWKGWGREYPVSEYTDLTGGILEIAWGQETRLSIPLLRQSNTDDMNELNSFYEAIPWKLAKGGQEIPTSVRQAVYSVLTINQPLLLTVSNQPFEFWQALHPLERDIASRYFAIRLA